ncbi:RNA polymerase factor sigma-54 [Oricola cellulosilytica]|uniref:RNA polymerase sigma-54 factor n=1 Tax=Oricola cellulosilytica TaxID=1429082 RepID=A0A4R0PET0_9HYPH|nr:RNA polymerase factor sigma-54 [Oricola cellulosilytica]TCD16315.1 RNA polymerase sigma-54 factor [Oricola cellulosilytica]
MALAAKLNLRQSQSMVMTPQLLQSIRLLQFSHLELERFVRDQIETNPLLDAGEGDGAAGDAGGDAGAPSGVATANAQPEDGWSVEAVEVSAPAIADTFDASLENVFPDDAGESERAGASGPAQSAAPNARLGGDFAAGPEIDLEAVAAAGRTLRDQVIEQISLTVRDPARRIIAYELADALDPNGYVEADFSEIAERLSCGAEDVAATLAEIQEFDPPGLFARDLSECLALQLRRKNRFDPAMEALLENLPLLARRDFKVLSRICGVGEGDLIDMLGEIRALDPKPGTAFQHEGAEPIVHDVEVREAEDGTWRIELNPDALPRVIVNRDYHARVSRSGLAPDEKTFMTECLQNATWLERSLDQRANTILKVAAEIVAQQDAFLVHGVSALKPMTMRMVADAIKMHESTVSRVSASKYMLTPRGIFDFRYFFTVAISANDPSADGHSSEAVRERIRRLIDEEAADAVLSDDALVALLGKEGIEIARRTVAKYREGMNIASSVQRRREKRALALAGA